MMWPFTNSYFENEMLAALDRMVDALRDVELELGRIRGQVVHGSTQTTTQPVTDPVPPPRPAFRKRKQSSHDYYTLDETLRLLNIDENRLKRLVSEGEIRAFREGDQMKFSVAEISALAGKPAYKTS